MDGRFVSFGARGEMFEARASGGNMFGGGEAIRAASLKTVHAADSLGRDEAVCIPAVRNVWE